MIWMNVEFKILLVQEAAEEFHFKHMNKPSVFGPAGGTRPERSPEAFIVLAFPSRPLQNIKKAPKTYRKNIFSTKYPVNLRRKPQCSVSTKVI